MAHLHRSSYFSTKLLNISKLKQHVIKQYLAVRSLHLVHRADTRAKPDQIIHQRPGSGNKFQFSLVSHGHEQRLIPDNAVNLHLIGNDVIDYWRRGNPDLSRIDYRTQSMIALLQLPLLLLQSSQHRFICLLIGCSHRLPVSRFAL